MTNQERMVAVTLSRSEMLLIAALLQSRGIMGVEPSTAGTEEQRATDWMTFQSLAHCLDPGDPNRTVEGYPAPKRAVIVATAP